MPEGDSIRRVAADDNVPRPARRAGAFVVLVDGALALFVEPKGKRIATGDLPPELIELALSVGAPQIAAKQRRRELLIETIDGEPAGTSPWAKPLLANGGRIDYRGLVVRGSLVAPPPAEDDEADDTDA